MKKFLSTYLLNIIAAMALMMTAAACVDDTDLPEVAAPGTSVTIRIPNPAAAHAFARSRAEAAADSPANAATNVGARGSSPAPAVSRAEEKDLDTKAKEGDIHSLWLLAYNTDNSDYNVIRQLQSSGQLTHEYSEYRIEFKPGKYRIYVVANLDEYITGEISASTEESYLEKLILNFSPDKLPNTTDGLPMACLPAQVDGATDGNITVEAGTTKTIQTDLTFLCAKVRYTILFDNSEGGFSREAFGSSTVTFNTASLTGVRKKTPLTDAVNALDGAFEVGAQLRAVTYPNDLSDPKDLSDLKDAADANKRAWQGTMYLPENLLTGARTILHLGATLDGNGANLSYTVKLPKNAAEANDSEPDYTLTRGHFYDLVGRVTTIGDQIDITASVADWTLQALTYALHGPYFLHVDKTEIKVTAGVETLLMYDTDAPTLGFESPKYGGTNLDLFQFKPIEQDGKKYISVTTNPAIPAENNRSFDSYFYIKAANLYKRIEVNPVSLEPFLNVSPTEIEINIAEYIASGDYEAEIPIEFITNLPSVTITQTGGDWDNSKIELKGDKSYTDPQGTNTLKIKGFNDGKWPSDQTFTFTLTYTATNGTNTETETVNITVKPNILDYVIHLRVPETWTMPHIYVYQCLQFPADLKDGDYPYSDRRSKPVGETENLAALEYAFTSKIAFKGWKGYGGPDINDPYEVGNFKKGFFVFSSTNTYNPNNENRYFQNMDFSATHRKDGITACPTCAGGSNNLWPGICMIKESNGWWKYTLTGIATPGKALIMFTNAHNSNNTYVLRYPGHEQVGIPLFDYPSREGWFDYSNFATQFSPSSDLAKRPQKARIYWTKTNQPNPNYIHVWVNDAGTTKWNTDYEINTNTGEINGYYYFDFDLKSDWEYSTTINYHLKKTGNTANEKSVRLYQFSKMEGGNILAVTLNENGEFKNSGIPDATPAHNPTQFEPGMKITFKWLKSISNSNQIHIWEEGVTNNEGLTTWNTTDYPDSEDATYRYKTVTTQRYKDRIYYILHSSSTEYNPGGTGIHWNDVKNNHYNSATNTVEWTITN